MDGDDFDSFFDNSEIKFEQSYSNEDSFDEMNRLNIVLFQTNVAQNQQLGGFLRIDAPKGIGEGKIYIKIKSTLTQISNSDIKELDRDHYANGLSHEEMLEQLREDNLKPKTINNQEKNQGQGQGFSAKA